MSEARPPATAEELAAAEAALAELGHTIPPSYRAFLTEHDGGRPVASVFAFEQDNQPTTSGVDWFLGVARVEGWMGGDLVGNARMLGDRVPAGVLPIADDPVGNLVCIDTRSGGDGPVLFWDHEYEGDPPDEANLYVVAPDFPSFLASLREPEPLPPPEPRGLKRLFGRR